MPTTLTTPELTTLATADLSSVFGGCGKKRCCPPPAPPAPAPAMAPPPSGGDQISTNVQITGY